MDESPDKAGQNPKLRRDEAGRLLPGTPSLNPAGRPKGKTLKEFAREMLMSMDDTQKRAYLKKLPPEIVWRMSEGNPHQTTDVAGEVTIVRPLLEAIKPNVRHNIIDQADSSAIEADTGNTGGDFSGQDGSND